MYYYYIHYRSLIYKYCSLIEVFSMVYTLLENNSNNNLYINILFLHTRIMTEVISDKKPNNNHNLKSYSLDENDIMFYLYYSFARI